MILNTKRIHNSFRRNFPARAKQMPSFICRQEKATTAAVRSLRAKMIIVGNSKWVKKIIIFVPNYLTTKQLFTSVSVASGGYYLAASRPR